MRSATLLVCAVACAQTQPPPGELLARVSERVLNTVDRLPRYMCTETIDRKQYEPGSGRSEPCEPASRRLTFLATSDRLRMDVAVSAGTEMYSWVGESHFEDRGLFGMVGTGAVSTGSFSAFLTVIFRTDNTAFSYAGPVTEAGRQLERFEFHVPHEMSHYFYSGNGSRVITGYMGAILVDPQTADLVRLEVHTEGLPPETGSCQSSSTLDYRRLRLHDTDFLLPGRVELYILDANGVESRNTTVFSGCHEFLGESTLSFGTSPEVETAGGALALDGSELPPGLPLQMAFTRSIDPATAAAGDRIDARLTESIRGADHRTLVPKGAAVTLRLLEMRRFYEPRKVLRLVLKPETVEIGGTPRPLAAAPDARPAAVMPNPGAMHQRPAPVVRLLLDSKDPHAAVLEYFDVRSDVLPAGFESSWVTAIPKPPASRR